MSKLLQRAKIRKENAQHSYQKMGIDDAYIDDCCYNLQQCIEFTLKYIVEMHGENYVENHDIRAQLNKLNELNVNIPNYHELRRLATTINSWQVDSRYNDDFFALIDDIDEAKIVAEKLIEFADSLVIEEK